MTSTLPTTLHLKLWQRVLLVAWAGFLVAGFGLATQLSPDVRGFGTHQQLGFPPCTFRFLWGILCPTCGGTTSFSHFVRGEWLQSGQANLGCFFLALGCVALIPASLWAAVSGRIRQFNLVLWIAFAWLAIVCGTAVIQWIWRVDFSSVA